jgi:hypothetical protein
MSGCNGSSDTSITVMSGSGMGHRILKCFNCSKYDGTTVCRKGGKRERRDDNVCWR